AVEALKGPREDPRWSEPTDLHVQCCATPGCRSQHSGLAWTISDGSLRSRISKPVYVGLGSGADTSPSLGNVRFAARKRTSDLPGNSALGSRLIKSTIQEQRRGRQRPGNFAPACRSGLRCA